MNKDVQAYNNSESANDKAISFPVESLQGPGVDRINRRVPRSLYEISTGIGGDSSSKKIKTLNTFL
jgi:hypothetical protein